jgi:hypothetical protein
MTAIVTYPAGAIKLTQFFGPNVRVLVDGKPFESHRLDIVFPSEDDVKSAMAKLVRVATANRSDAIAFILRVLDEYQPILESGPVNTKDIVG